MKLTREKLKEIIVDVLGSLDLEEAVGEEDE